MKNKAVNRQSVHISNEAKEWKPHLSQACLNDLKRTSKQ